MMAGLLALLLILGGLYAFAKGLQQRSGRLLAASLVLSEIALLLLQMLALRQFSPR